MPSTRPGSRRSSGSTRPARPIRAAITTACTQADSVSSAGYYYEPCQDSTNVDNYLQFQENTTVNYKVRIRNTGNINLSSLTYAFTINGVNVGAPGNCNTLPTSLAKAAAPAFCSFSRSATSTNPGSPSSDDNVVDRRRGLRRRAPDRGHERRGDDQGHAGAPSRDQPPGVRVPPRRHRLRRQRRGDLPLGRPVTREGQRLDARRDQQPPRLVLPHRRQPGRCRERTSTSR